MKAIVNTHLVLEDGIVWDGAIAFAGDTIVAVGPADQIQIPPDAEILDAQGLYTAPGFVDIHLHGGGAHMFYQDPAKCTAWFLRHGETTQLPTFYATLSLAEMLEGAKRIRKLMGSGIGKAIVGLYMEGPYMNGIGSFQNAMKWQGEICAAAYRPLVDQLGALVRVWAIDPARPNIEEFMQYAKKVHPQTIFAFGHSHATAAQCRSVKKYGVKVQTHHGDSGKAKGFAQGTIGAGCDEFTLYDPELYAELICDQNGIHVAPDMIKLVVRTKGVERMVLITDAMPRNTAYTNNEADGIGYGPDLNYDDEGHLAGSCLTMDAACRNLMTHTGYGLCHAVRFASTNPARLLGIDNAVGSLAPGKKANIILLDDMVHIKRVYLEGKLVSQTGEMQA